MGCKDTVGARFEADWIEKIDSYGTSQGYEDRSDALKELVKVGYREKHSPLMYRAKRQAKDAAFYLSLVAVVTVVIGMMTTVLTAGNSIQIAMVLLAFGAAPLAIVEVCKMVLDYSTRARGEEL